MRSNELLSLEKGSAVRIESQSIVADGKIDDMTTDGIYADVTLTRIDSQKGNLFSVGETHGFPAWLLTAV